jgi:hypothetical protein
MNGTDSLISVTPNLIRQFDYRPHRLKLMVLFLLAAAGTCVLSYLAVAPGGPIRVRGFQLTQAQTRILFKTFALLSPVGLIPLGALVFVAFAYDRRVAVTTSSLILPRPTRLGLSCDEIEIPLRSITKTGVHDFLGSTKVFRIEYQRRIVHIPANMFRDKKTFEELTSVLLKAIAAARTGETS